MVLLAARRRHLLTRRTARASGYTTTRPAWTARHAATHHLLLLLILLDHRLGQELKQFDVEHQRRVRRNRTCAFLAIAELRRQPETILRALVHQLQALGETGDHTAQGHRGRLLRLVEGPTVA